MTLYEFSNLNEREQAEVIWRALLVSIREDDEHRILLYQIDDFYVDVYFHKEFNVIRLFLPFKTKRQLAPFYNITLN